MQYFCVILVKKVRVLIFNTRKAPTKHLGVLKELKVQKVNYFVSPNSTPKLIP